MNVLNKAARLWHNEGSITLGRKGMQFGYDTYIRPLLPKHVVSYNDIPVRASHLGDSIVPWHEKDIPNYEGALITGIQQYVESGDTVVIVGGGWGVSTVAAAIQTGEHGRIITYEGGEETAKKVKDTVQLNDVDDRVSVQHTIVGEGISLRDDGTSAEEVSPSKLPDCDVLVLDCEGAELKILENIEIQPGAIVVETHGMFGATEAAVRDKLSDIGYAVIESKVAERRLKDTCEENDIYVLFSVPHDTSVVSN